MKRKVVFISLLMSLVLFSFYADETSDSIISSISTTDIKIGEKINLTIKIPNLKDAKVLWEDLTHSDQNVEIYTKKDVFKKGYLILEIVFTFFDAGEYSDFIFTLPISTPDGEMLYLETDKYNINVKGPLTEEELENIKNIKDPSKIELRKEKEQAKIPFHFSTYVKVIIFIILLVLVGLAGYYFFYKFIMKKGKEIEKAKIPPYQKFLASLQMILFNPDDDRKVIEKKLSDLTEILKELIFEDFDLNATVETTRELLASLKSLDFDQSIVLKVTSLFNEIDMVKFAKAPVDFDKLHYYYESIKSLGREINDYRKTIFIDEEIETEK